MTGQPLSSLKAKGEAVFGPLGIDNGPPELMAIVAKVIAEWSLAQAHLASAFAEIIGSRSPATVSIYASFDSFSVQRQMLLTSASELLPQRTFDVLRALLIIVERAAKERHRFAHWVWGSLLADELSEKLLLLADPKQLTRMRAKQISHFNKLKSDTRKAHATQPRLGPKDIIAFREADLRRSWRQMRWAAACAFEIECLVRIAPKQWLERQRKLLAQPLVRAEYHKLRPRRTRRPIAAPKSLRVSSRGRREAALAKGQPKGG